MQDGLGGVEAAGVAVFVEAVFEPGAGVVGGLSGGNVIKGGEIGLGADGGEVEEGVLVFDVAEDFFGVDAVQPVEGDEVVFLFADALEAVHPVVGGGEDFAVGALVDAVIPRGPATGGAGHEGGIRVEGGGVGLVVKFGKESVFLRRGIGEEGEGLIAVAGEEDFIEGLRRAIGEVDGGVSSGAADGGDGAVFVNAVGKGGGDFPDVTLGAAGDGPPLVLGAEAEEAVVLPEAQKCQGGEGFHFFRRGAPDGAAHGDEVVLEHVFAVVRGRQCIGAGTCRPIGAR